MITLTLSETVAEVDASRGTVQIVSSAGPTLEPRSPREDPAEYTEAVKLLADGAMLHSGEIVRVASDGSIHITTDPDRPAYIYVNGVQATWRTTFLNDGSWHGTNGLRIDGNWYNVEEEARQQEKARR